MNDFFKKENRFNLLSFIIGFFWLLAGSMFFIVPLYVIGPKISGLSFSEYIQNTELIAEHSYIPGCLGHMLGITLFVILFKKTIIDDSKSFKNNWWKYLIVIVLGAVLLYASGLLMNWIYELCGKSPDETSQNQQSIINALHGSTKIFVIMFTTILAPIFEEIVFRKLFYNTLKQNTRLPIWAIVLIISTVFAGIHVMSDIESLIYFPQYFILALIITTAYAVTKENIFVSIGLHAVNNILSVLEILL